MTCRNGGQRKTLFLTSAVAITAVFATRKRPQRRRSCWVRQFGTFNSLHFKVLASVQSILAGVEVEFDSHRQCGLTTLQDEHTAPIVVATSCSDGWVGYSEAPRWVTSKKQGFSDVICSARTWRHRSQTL